ncbi:MAG: sulfatase-like hydrolase/transferase, partial [Candidatus Omnitrophica bacterium]|nr:sulfatase-like hydrolase/transferase [Candidatus Omnitrophota bacterium]MBU4467739.1 sulfatase-like hydrolase/transferase [Candidatus Omnitrophota bacterium]MCG2707049.1 sulfatase-like hydrolase/transferase [Candidatus Omnitrophota bacterium]
MKKPNKFILLISLIFGLLAIALAEANSLDKPNVLFISIDALRPEHVACYGYERDTSFNINRLAKEGVFFRKAIAQSSVARTSVPSMLTGMYPKNHGVYWFGDTINPRIATLAEVLKKAGYRTMGGSVGGRLNYLIGHGVNRGFDKFMDFSKDEEIAPWISQWINGSNKTPFFIWAHYCSLHSVSHPPAPYDTLYVDDKLKPFFAKREPRFYSMPVLIDGELAEDYKSYYVSQYDGAIRFVDD